MVVHLDCQADLKRSYQDPGPSGLNNALPFSLNIVLRNKYNVSGRKEQFSSKDEISPCNG